MQWTSHPGPRLLAALHLDGAELRAGPSGDDLPEDVAPGLSYWVPTVASLPVDELVPAPSVGRPDPLDPRAPVTASPHGRHRRTGRRRDRRPRLVEAPASVRGARWEAGRPALIGLCVAIVCVSAVLGLRVLSARADARPRDVAPAVTSSTPTSSASGRLSRTQPGFGGAAGAPGASGVGAAPSGGGAPVAASVVRARVHVVGRVRHPGVVVLVGGSRVEDAVRAAGGFAAGADQGAVNLARPVADGEQIRIPAPGEALPPTGAGSGGPSVPGAGAGSGGSAGATRSTLSINTADAAALDSLPGVGQVLAGRIVAWREEHGRFTSVEELGEVSGIGEKLLAQLTPLVTL